MYQILDMCGDVSEPARFEILLIFYGLLKSETDRLQVILNNTWDEKVQRAFTVMQTDCDALFMELMKYAPGISTDKPSPPGQAGKH